MRPRFVLDASILSAVLLREPPCALVEELLRMFAIGKIDILEPSLWHYEIANTLHHNASRAGDRETLLHAYTQLRTIGFTTRDPEPKETDQAFAILSATSGQTYYDAIYHAIALVQKGTLLTADRRYMKAAARWGHILTLDEVQPLLRRLQK